MGNPDRTIGETSDRFNKIADAIQLYIATVNDRRSGRMAAGITLRQWHIDAFS
jgi:hypothetical protein